MKYLFLILIAFSASWLANKRTLNVGFITVMEKIRYISLWNHYGKIQPTDTIWGD
ncbi:exported hypothetical protein [Xenorhabdus szentirmaii DSM 16338]|uniref:Uncharacterized protein n=1 Tax=Xenorhabdus szentirmaii DSM 16338 TaxID=1427518 RepID=W1J3C2_9GAMM|nr:exported hypothetical protein [Xenorhabdus szentirmaii DSM 16338]